MTVDWLILADSAQVVGGKLYLLGGGWDVLTVLGTFPVTQQCAVAAAFCVPWNETNQRHTIEMTIEDQDGRELAKIAGDVEVGRPAGIPPGADQRIQLANQLMLEFQQAGEYRIIARLDGGDVVARTPFRIVGWNQSVPHPKP